MKKVMTVIVKIALVVLFIIGFCIVSKWDYEDAVKMVSIMAIPGAFLRKYYRFVAWVIKKFNLQVRVVRIFPNFYMGIAFPKGGKMQTGYTVTISIYGDRPFDVTTATLEQAHDVVMDSCLNANDSYCIRHGDEIIETNE